ncbi:hypothetical protein EVAR_67593_1 [Eumeta japonica]|uniref:Uncharacterized protein n=1 Tax=Eumeta variegata TaxID=151549 RepID=A0A4C1SIB1_EUMVA|nr:hypothetical protein EVAR_67593_1 [Eumeta japonica]
MVWSTSYLCSTRDGIWHNTSIWQCRIWYINSCSNVSAHTRRFGGFGTTSSNTTTAPTLGGFGNFGAGVTQTSQAPNLFGTSTATSTGFGGFGNVPSTSAAPNFGSLVQLQRAQLALVLGLHQPHQLRQRLVDLELKLRRVALEDLVQVNYFQVVYIYHTHYIDSQTSLA